MQKKKFEYSQMSVSLCVGKYMYALLKNMGLIICENGTLYNVTVSSVGR